MKPHRAQSRNEVAWLAGALALMAVACATPALRRPTAVSSLGSLIIAQVQPTPQLPSISWADLERARALLAQAQQQLQPQQYELLQHELAEAEVAWQRFSTAARASGHAAELARDAKAISAAKRASRLSEGLGKLSRVGPLLVALALLWPSRTAGPDLDPPPWLAARLELEAKLEKVSSAARQVGEQIEAAGRKPVATPRPERKEPVSLPDETTCIWVGVGGGGRPVICRYHCDGVEDIIEVTLPESMVQCPGETSNPLKWRQIKRYPQRL